MVNHFEEHKELSSKTKLLKNLLQICRKEQIFIFDIVPITFVIDFDSDCVDSEFEEFFSFFIQKCNNNQPDLVSADLIRRKNYYKIVSDKEKPSFSAQDPISNKNSKKYSGYLAPRNNTTLFKGSNIWLFKPSDNNRG